jgi:hypothetical protein
VAAKEFFLLYQTVFPYPGPRMLTYGNHYADRHLLNGRELRSNALRREFSAGVIGALPAGKLLY